MAERPSVFLTWSHSHPSWTASFERQRKQDVHALAEVLRSNGVAADVDLYYLNHGVDWTRLGPQLLWRADVVIIVASQGWKDAWEGTGDPARGAGAAAEADVLRSLYAQDRERFIQRVRLVLLPNATVSDVPLGLHGVTRYDIDPVTVTGAEDLLRDLTDQPRYPSPALGPLPNFESETHQLWNLPRQSLIFTGRELALEEIVLATTQGGVPVVVLVGLGGAGKTQLALEYANRAREKFSVGWFVRGETEDSRWGDMAEFASEVGSTLVGSDTKQRAAAARRWLERNSGWLLVVDNVEDPNDLEEILPHSGEGVVIATSRNSLGWRPLARTVTVGNMSKSEAIDLLRRWVPDDDQYLDEVALRLGRLPLGLAQAGAFLEATGTAARQLVEMLDATDLDVLSLQPEVAALTGYPSGFSVLFGAIVEALRARFPGTIPMLARLAFTAPDRVPIELLEGDRSGDTYAQAELFAALLRLQRFSLISVASGEVTIHRLVQASIRAQLSPVESLDAIGQLLNRLIAAMPKYLDARTLRWEEGAKYTPHALAVGGFAVDRGLEPLATGEIFARTVRFTMFNDTTAETLMATALRLVRSVLDPSDPRIADYLVTMAVNYRFMVRYASADECFGEAIEILEKHPGEVREQLGVALRQRGICFRQAGNLEGASECLLRSYALLDDATSLAARATTASELGILRLDEGEYDEAQTWLTSAAADHEALVGRQTVLLSSDLDNLGLAQMHLGLLHEARASIEAALEIDRDVFGDDHPEVATDLCHLGMVHSRLGEIPEAIEYFEGALAIRAQEDRGNPKVAEIVVALAEAKLLVGDRVTAEGLLSETALALERKLGADHPTTVSAKEKLAKLRE